MHLCGNLSWLLTACKSSTPLQAGKRPNWGLRGKMLCFHGRECFDECVGHHVVGWAVDKLNGATFHDVSNKMELNVDMFCLDVILMIFYELDGRLIVWKQSCWVKDSVKKLGEEETKPEGFFCTMSDSDIFGFSHWQGNNLLSFSTPQNSAAVNQKRISWDGMPILSHAPICIHVPSQIHLQHSIGQP